MEYIPNPFDVIPVSFHVATWMIWIPFGLFLLVYASISGVLYFHWISYGMKTKAILLTEFIFLVGTVFFLYLAFLGISL